MRTKRDLPPTVTIADLLFGQGADTITIDHRKPAFLATVRQLRGTRRFWNLVSHFEDVVATLAADLEHTAAQPFPRQAIFRAAAITRDPNQAATVRRHR